MTGAEESQLLRDARTGDTRAFSGLVRLYQGRIYGLVRRLVHDEDVAEELTQDAFLKAYRRLDSFRGDARFSTWLYRIAVNVCHDYRGSRTARSRRTEDSLDLPETPEARMPRAGTRPDEEVATREMAEAFQASLDALGPNYREAFLLRHQEDLGYEQIAEVLDISVSNAKVRVHRAREMILDALREQGHDV